jgi:hypothetical protein
MGGYSISLQGQQSFEHTSAFLHKANNVSCCIQCALINLYASGSSLKGIGVSQVNRASQIICEPKAS